MKAKWPALLAILMAVLYLPHIGAAVNKTVWPAAPSRSFVFIENNSDSNFFVTPGAILDPRMTGSNRWTGLKYNGRGTIYQQSLGYIDNGYNTPLTPNYYFDMWLENSPVSHPLLGLRCINWYSGCNMTTSLIVPPATDAKGFYGVKTPAGGAKWMHGMMSDTFYQYLQQMPVGGTLSMTMNACQTTHSYDARTGGRCKDQPTGHWYVREVKHLKAATLRLINTNALSEIFINSDGIPTIGAGNMDCHLQTIGSKTGLSCKMVDYVLEHNGLSNNSIHIFPSINNSSLAASIGSNDMQFSLDGRAWKPVQGTGSFYTFNQLKASTSVSVFFSNTFFKKMVTLGISDINTKDLFNFRFKNDVAPESGWYEFSTSGTLIIKPRDFSISIISDEYKANPSRTGFVGTGKPSLDFGYVVTTSGKTAADKVQIKVEGPTQAIGGRSYCIFRSANGMVSVPFPAVLTYSLKSGGIKTFDIDCQNVWHDMADALWLTTPWSDSSGNLGEMNKTTVKFSILMDNAISRRTVDNSSSWFGEVSASGKIHVQATWNNVN